MQKSLKAGVSSLQWIVDGYMLAFAGPDADRRHARRPVRPQEDPARRRRALLRRVARRRRSPTTRTMLIVGRVVMGVGAAALRAGDALAHPPDLPRRPPACPGARDLDVGLRHLARGRPRARRRARRACGLARDLLVQPGLRAARVRRRGVDAPESSDPEGRSLDVRGLVAGAVAVMALTFAVIEGESAGFTTWWIAAALRLAAVAAVAFVLIERQQPRPVLRLEYFRIPAFSSANAVAFATSFGLFAVFFFTALYLQMVAKFSGLRRSRCSSSAMAVAMVVAGQVAGRWTAARGPRSPMVARLPPLGRRHLRRRRAAEAERVARRARGRARARRLRPRARARRRHVVGALDRSGRAVRDGAPRP